MTCKHPSSHVAWARRKGVTLPHCGDPHCPTCPGKYKGTARVMEHVTDAMVYYLSTPSTTEETFRRFFDRPFVKHT